MSKFETCVIVLMAMLVLCDLFRLFYLMTLVEDQKKEKNKIPPKFHIKIDHEEVFTPFEEEHDER